MWSYLQRRNQRRLAHQVLVGRSRSDRFEDGRFDAADVDQLLKRAEAIVEELTATVPREPTIGARLMMRSAVLTLATYRAVREFGVDRPYAVELCTDLMWKAYKQQVTIPRLIGRLWSRDPRVQMDVIQGLFLRYSLASPGYDCKMVGEGSSSYDIRRCPVNDWFATQSEEEMDFFRKSWCTLDWPLAEHLVEGGCYERTTTLSHGGDACDMRWGASDT